MEELRARLTGAEKLDTQENAASTKSESVRSNGINGSPPALPEKPPHRVEVQGDTDKGTQRSESNVSNGVIVCLWSPQSSEKAFTIDAWVLLVFFWFFT